jgi:HK97 family phage prohead protease
MITVKMVGHKNQDVYSITGRSEGIRFFKDISKDGVICDPVEVEKGYLLEKTEGEENKVSIRLSDSGLDRDEERVLSSGWVLDNYLKNPVVLWSHDRTRPAIGYMESLSSKDALDGIINFVDKSIDHFGWSIGQKLSLGILRAGSVGFNPIEWKFIDDPSDPAWLEFSRQELMEFSICNVPANPRSLVLNDSVPGAFKNLDTIESMLLELTSRLSKDDNTTTEQKKSIYDVLGRAASTVQSLKS